MNRNTKIFVTLIVLAIIGALLYYFFIYESEEDLDDLDDLALGGQTPGDIDFSTQPLNTSAETSGFECRGMDLTFSPENEQICAQHTHKHNTANENDCPNHPGGICYWYQNVDAIDT